MQSRLHLRLRLHSRLRLRLHLCLRSRLHLHLHWRFLIVLSEPCSQKFTKKQKMKTYLRLVFVVLNVRLALVCTRFHPNMSRS